MLGKKLKGSEKVSPDCSQHSGGFQRTNLSIGEIMQPFYVILAFTFTIIKSCREEYAIFWDITLCSPLSVNRRFGGTYRLHPQGSWVSAWRIFMVATCLHAGFLLNLFLLPSNPTTLVMSKKLSQMNTRSNSTRVVFLAILNTVQTALLLLLLLFQEQN
jgi:hypothetical protein